MKLHDMRLYNKSESLSLVDNTTNQVVGFFSQLEIISM